jgi:hypothetical protein
MAINLNGKDCDALSTAIVAAGHWMRMHNNVLVCSNEAAVQAIINGFDLLAEQKARRIATIKADGMVRINLIFPAIKTLDDLDLEAERWKSIAAAAKPNPTADYLRLINTYTAAKNAITSVNACTTKAQIDAVTPAWPA